MTVQVPTSHAIPFSTRIIATIHTVVKSKYLSLSPPNMVVSWSGEDDKSESRSRFWRRTSIADRVRLEESPRLAAFAAAVTATLTVVVAGVDALKVDDRVED